MRRETAAKWLVKAEELAGLPKLVGGVFHPYRRLWATERKDLPLMDVAAAGGWKDTQALRLSYQHAAQRRCFGWWKAIPALVQRSEPPGLESRAGLAHRSWDHRPAERPLTNSA